LQRKLRLLGNWGTEANAHDKSQAVITALSLYNKATDIRNFFKPGHEKIFFLAMKGEGRLGMVMTRAHGGLGRRKAWFAHLSQPLDNNLQLSQQAASNT
jgi:hypothetical protein